VKDAVEMTLYFLQNRDAGGLFNVGTGKARTWNSLAAALFSSLGKPLKIDYVEMPSELEGKYQYFTQANTGKIRAAGCAHQCMSLEDSVRDYVCSYLLEDHLLGDESGV